MPLFFSNTNISSGPKNAMVVGKSIPLKTLSTLSPPLLLLSMIIGIISLADDVVVVGGGGVCCCC
jgi:hypothetical protein